MNLVTLLQEKFAAALAPIVPDPAPYAALVKAAQDPKHGDYQANCAMSLAKTLGQKPREVAEQIVARLDLGDELEEPQIAGPGFINLRFRTDWLGKRLQSLAGDDRLGVEPAKKPQTFVVDFSSPNVAKPMHVGHLRSTIIGDCLARLLRFLGQRVVTDNHLGDWGTQFGILLYGYKHFRDEAALKADPVREMVRLYIHVRGLMKSEEDAEDATDPIADAVRQETVKLHQGDPENVGLWQTFMPWCLEEIDRVYRRLGVQFDHTLGESFYNPMLPAVVHSLLERGIARESEGAIVVGDDDPPALVRKKDGAFTYTTTDLATIRYRTEQWQPDAVLYVVDFRQSLHFQKLFETARRWGYSASCQHLSFGSVLGADRKPIKTREGGAVELGELLDEAVGRAAAVYEQSRQERRERGEDVPDLDEAERHKIAEVVGLGAVKYADLSQNRSSDYVFSWEKMLAMEGNTATYMQYAYARIRSIFRKGGEDEEKLRQAPPQLSLAESHERALAIQILRLPETLAAAAGDYKPNIITSYLWDLAKAYSGFYQNCPVLKAPPDVRRERLMLCDLTARTIRTGLNILGIETVERM